MDGILFSPLQLETSAVAVLHNISVKKMQL